MIARLDKSDSGNRPYIRVAKLVSAFHSKRNCVDVIAPFCEAGIA
jgi:hypothetical protein